MSDHEFAYDYISKCSRIGFPEPEPDSNELPQSYRDKDAKQEMMATFGLDSDALRRDLYVRQVRDEDEHDQLVRTYFVNSTHLTNIRIVNIWRVVDINRTTRFIENQFHRIENWLLFHGTKRHNLLGILEHGLGRPGGQEQGCVFFADRACKSSTFTDQSGAEVMLVCQVATGQIFKTGEGIPPDATNKAYAILNSGLYVPDENEHQVMDICKVPIGPIVFRNGYNNGGFNEYILNDPDRILVKYIIHFERRFTDH